MHPICTRCEGCCNPGTHPLDGGVPVDTTRLAENVLSERQNIEGVTLTGGEPLIQPEAVADLLERIHRVSPKLSVVLFTGFEFNALPRDEAISGVLSHTDVVIAGPFDQKRILGRGLRGSSNQTIHLLTQQYAMTDIENVPPGEVLIAPDGTMTLSGVETPVFK